ncbi:MAG: hypothetical protein ACREU2_18640, partial [Steroidobacteraceae bacterium]
APAPPLAPSAPSPWRWLGQVRERARTAWLGVREQLRDRPVIAALRQRTHSKVNTNTNTNAHARTAGQQHERARKVATTQPAIALQPRSAGADQSHSPRQYAPAYTRAYVPQIDDAARESLRNWHAYRQNHPELSADPARSLRNWHAYRQNHPELSADPARESVRNWAATYGQPRQRGIEHARGPGNHREQVRRHEHPGRGLSASDGPQRSASYDFDLSL